MDNTDIVKKIAHAKNGWHPGDVTVSLLPSQDVYRATCGDAWTDITGLQVADAIADARWPEPNEGAMRDNKDGNTEVYLKGKWKVWDKKLPDAGHPTKEKRETQEADMDQVRRAFHDKIIRVSDKHTRMVGWAPNLDTRDYEQDAAKMTVWFPSTVFDPEAKFNLVFSLASDGMHYPIEDHDEEQPPERKVGGLLIPSTRHWHRYWQVPHTWLQLGTTLTTIKVKNPNYFEQVMRTGHNAARPPWVEKVKGEPALMRFMEDFKDIEPWKYENTPATPENEGWDALWEDEDE